MIKNRKNVWKIFHNINLLRLTQIFYNMMNVGKETKCPICKKKFIEHSELQDKICKMITIKQFANISPGFDVQHRPFFEDWISIVLQSGFVTVL